MNTKTYRSILVTIIVLSCSVLSKAQGSVGVSSSASGFGITSQWIIKDGQEINSFNLILDSYGMLSGISDTPGASFSFTRDYVFKYIVFEHFDFIAYAGTGAMIGYVRDYEKGIFKSPRKEFEKEMGWAIGMCGSLGIILDYDRNISLGFSINPIFGAHIRQEQYAPVIKLSLYKNGLMQTVLPKISIMYRF